VHLGIVVNARRRAALAVLLFAAATVPAIGGSDAPAISGTDVLGHTLQLATPPERIVSLSPSLTEILFAIGSGAPRVVGVTNYCNHPAAARSLPSVGGVVDPSLEAVLARRPDLVLATRGNPLEFMESLIALGVPVYALETRGELSRIEATIREVGRVIGRAGAADSLAESLRARRERVRRRTAALPAARRPRVYYGELEGTLWTAGPGSYIDGVIAAAGGENVAGEAPSAWCALSLEEIVARDPQVFLGTFTGADSAARREARMEEVRELLANHPAWAGTRLGREPRIFLVHEDRLLRPGPRIYEVLEQFARFLHPDLEE
jgi:iron complex transport system substrate-binding protein